jgi:oral-facial-digital syndrome 1 protein
MQDQGLVDNLKVKIRQKLIEKLKHEQKTKEVEPNALFVKKLCSSLFIDYLRVNNYDYTLSVFSPECGFSNTLLIPD